MTQSAHDLPPSDVPKKPTSRSDILLTFDAPSIGFVTFTGLTEHGTELLRWMVDDELVDGDRAGASLSMPLSDADTVYQTALMNGLCIVFEDGTTMRLPADALADLEDMIAQIDVATQVRALRPQSDD
jgi:hypothetical protein